MEETEKSTGGSRRTAPKEFTCTKCGRRFVATATTRKYCDTCRPIAYEDESRAAQRRAAQNPEKKERMRVYKREYMRQWRAKRKEKRLAEKQARETGKDKAAPAGT